MDNLIIFFLENNFSIFFRNENSNLQSELGKLKEQLNTNNSKIVGEKKQWLQQPAGSSGSSGGSQLRKFGLLTTDPGLNPTTQKLVAPKSSLIDQNYHHHHHHHHHHILTGN